MLNPDFRDILLYLNEEGTEYIVVGAYALAAHGFPRATGDIDIFIRNDPENARKAMCALIKFGAPAGDLTEQDLTSENTIFQIGVEPCRIDLITGIHGLSFEEAWRNKIEITIDGITIYILSKADLLKNKLAAGRDKDQGDIAWLKKH